MRKNTTGKDGDDGGGLIGQDYVFESAADGGEVRFSELFAPGRDSLVIYNMHNQIFGPLLTGRQEVVVLLGEHGDPAGGEVGDIGAGLPHLG